MGLLGIAIGAALAVAGYKLWKYTIFLLGFIIMGALAFVITMAFRVTPDDPGADGPYFESAGAGIVVGIAGGFCFIFIYMLVIFCMGCACGMGGFWTLLGVGFTYLVAHGSTMAVYMADGANSGTIDTLIVVDLIIGIIMGVVFIKFQKICIMIGTSFLGSWMVFNGLFTGLFGASSATMATVNSILIFVGAGAGFYIQYTITSKGVEIDPKTGQVTVIIVQPGVAYAPYQEGLGQPIMAQAAVQPYMQQPQQGYMPQQPQQGYQQPGSVGSVGSYGIGHMEAQNKVTLE